MRISSSWLGAFMTGILLYSSLATGESARWWPYQEVPRGIVRTTDYDQFEDLVSASGQVFRGDNGPIHMMVQSVAGLAALAVNEGRDDEMVWVGCGHNTDYEDWYERMLGKQLYEVRGTFTPWELVKRFADKGMIEGYILYSYDVSEGDFNDHRPGMDLSINVATSLAGLMKGIVVEESLESQAKAMGLKLLFDARDKSQQWCFDTYKDQFNRKVMGTQDPRKPHIRDFIIAHKAFIFYGYDEPAETAMEWLEAPAPIIGWNGGDERESTLMSSIYGHFQTATDWCMNLPILMAGSEKMTTPRVRAFDPGHIDWNDRRSATSFIITDGDNVQWYMGGFYRQEKGSWWHSPDRGRFPFGWSCPYTHLIQVCPVAVDYGVDTQSLHCWMVEWGGGYYYPDHFGAKRENRKELLAQHARRTWENMKQSGTTIIGFNLLDINSESALEAYEIYAQEMEGLLAILTFQYYPYEGGKGSIHWVKDRRGIEVPVISARYSIWGNTDRPHAGTPAKIARLLNADARKAKETGKPALSWTITHCWSYFQPSAASGDHDEDMPQKDARLKGGIRGLTPVGWCVDRLSDDIQVVSPEELIWRIRMEHHPEQTRSLLSLE